MYPGTSPNLVRIYRRATARLSWVRVGSAVLVAGVALAACSSAGGGGGSGAANGSGPATSSASAVASSTAASGAGSSAAGSGGASAPGGAGGGVAASTAPSLANPVTITFANWADSETATKPGIEKMIADFEKTHPGITVKSEPISFTDIGHTLVLQVQSGNVPDVAELSGNDTFSVADTGALADLTPFLGSEKSAFIPSELSTGMYKDQLVGLPWTVNPPGLWYNKQLMKGAGLDPSKPPTTITELVSDLKTIKAKYPKIVPMGMDTTNRSFSLSSNWSWMLAYGAQPFNGSTATANTPAMQSYLGFMQELAKDGLLTAGHKIGEYRPLAAQNQVAFVWDQPVLQGVVQSTNHQTNAQFFANWGVTALPTGPSGKSYSVELGHQLVMFKKSAHQQADWEFMNWLATSTEAVTQYTIPTESSLPPLANPSPDVASLIDTPVLQAFKNDVLPTVVNPSYGATFGEASSPIMSAISQAVTGGTSPATIAQQMQSALTTAFK